MNRQMKELISREDLEKALKEMYVNRRMSLAEMGAQLDVPRATLRNWLKSFGIPLRSRKEKRVRRSSLKDVPLNEWRTLGVNGVVKKYRTTYEKAYGYFKYHQKEIEDELQEAVDRGFKKSL